MPLRKDLPSTYASYFTAHPEYKLFADQAARTVEVPNVTGSIDIWQEFRNQWSKSVIFGKADVDASLTAAAKKADELASKS
jgi:multiple sugar transport system substrate-binding protein